MFTPCPAQVVTFPTTASGVVKSMATSTPRQRASDASAVCSGDAGSTIPATSHPYWGARSAISRPIFP